jgi:radical SAM superfamily enzyme YgiQ (UPF0313 family)
MKVALISPYPDITNYGLRSISSWLRTHGHATQLICMPDRVGEGTTEHVQQRGERYTAQEIEDLLGILADAELVGISLMTHYFASACQITTAVHRRLGKPVVWGGFHASARPGECMEHADYVVMGEGEHCALALAERLAAGRAEDLSDIPGLVWKRGGEIVQNAPGTLEQDLDIFGMPDWSLEDHWLGRDGRVIPATPALLRTFLSEGTVAAQFGRLGYQTMTGRGCPHACAYCGNSFMRGLYPRQRYVRFRSVENVIRELEWIKKAFPWVDLMWLSDDSFFGRTVEELRHFAREYQARVGDPMYLLGSPATITEEKYALMVDAGLLCIQVGIEHGSARIQRLFCRANQGNDKILETARILAKYAHRTAPPHYDVIYDVAYETLEDQLETLRLIARLPKPYRLQVFTLVYYPGTALYTQALADGLIRDEQAEIYDRMFFERHDSYANTLLFLSRTGRFPHPLLRVLTHRRLAEFMTSESLRPLSDGAKVALKGMRRAKRRYGHLPHEARRILGALRGTAPPPRTT